MAQTIVRQLNADFLVMEDDNGKLGVYSVKSRDMLIDFELDGLRYLTDCDLLLVQKDQTVELISLSTSRRVCLIGSMFIDRIAEARDILHWRFSYGNPAIIHPTLKEE